MSVALLGTVVNCRNYFTAAVAGARGFECESTRVMCLCVADDDELVVMSLRGIGS